MATILGVFGISIGQGMLVPVLEAQGRKPPASIRAPQLRLQGAGAANAHEHLDHVSEQQSIGQVQQNQQHFQPDRMQQDLPHLERVNELQPIEKQEQNQEHLLSDRMQQELPREQCTSVLKPDVEEPQVENRTDWFTLLMRTSPQQPLTRPVASGAPIVVTIAPLDGHAISTMSVEDLEKHVVLQIAEHTRLGNEYNVLHAQYERDNNSDTHKAAMCINAKWWLYENAVVKLLKRIRIEKSKVYCRYVT
jgi:hypothetical protein